MKWVTATTFYTSVYQRFSCRTTENLYRKETGARREEKCRIKTYTKESTAQKFQWYLSKQCERYWSANNSFLVPGGPARLNLPKPRSISMDIKPWRNAAYRRRKGSGKETSCNSSPAGKNTSHGSEGYFFQWQKQQSLRQIRWNYI